MFHTVEKVAKEEFHYRSTFILDSEQCVIENWQFKSVMCKWKLFLLLCEPYLTFTPA
jgi:hypothetical protein